jgi:hypothetical protein
MESKALRRVGSGFRLAAGAAAVGGSTVDCTGNPDKIAYIRLRNPGEARKVELGVG